MAGPRPGLSLKAGRRRRLGWTPDSRPALRLASRLPRAASSSSLLLLHRLLLLLLFAARGSRESAGAPGLRKSRPRPETLAPRSYWLRPRARGRGRGGWWWRWWGHWGLDERREEAAPRRVVRPPRGAPLPRFPLLQPTRDVCARRRARGDLRGGASSSQYSRITWWLSGFPSPGGRGAPERGRGQPLGSAGLGNSQTTHIRLTPAPRARSDLPLSGRHLHPFF